MTGQFGKRVTVCYFVIVIAMFLVAMRIINIVYDPEIQAAANNAAVRKITLSQQRGTIFDCNMKPITNPTIRYTSLVTDIPKASVTLCDYFTEQEAADILAEIKNGRIPMINTEKDISGSGIISFKSYSHTQSIANHLIGYTDQSGHGVSGLEVVFDEWLYSDKKVTLSFGIDGLGSLIEGENIEYVRDSSIENSGVMITIDTDIQRAAEKAAEKLKVGAVVISEVATGEIKAMVSCPGFDINNLQAALENPDSPLLNRAMQTYNVGSGFKPCVAAAALESGKDKYICFCDGYSDIDGQIFRCHKTAGHKWLDMAGAIKYSCNAYFYNLAIEVGAEKVYDISQRAGFNNAISFGYGFSVKSAQIGDFSKLTKSKRALANLAIGQGELMVSPIGILTLYSAIAGDGSYYPLSLIKGRVENLQLTQSETENEKVYLMSKSVAEKLRNQLKGVLSEDGTGKKANPTKTSAAGKTSTAETGIIKDGKRSVNSWFCGFFPFEEPRYAVAVLRENSEEGCGDVFADIADEITELKKLS